MIVDDQVVACADTAVRRPFGWELRIDLAGCDPAVVDDVAAVRAWLAAVVAAVGMTPWGPPLVDRFGEADLYGVTGVQLITTSSVTVHCDPPDAVFVNVFSCRPFDPQTAIQVTVAWFRAGRWSHDFVVRRAPSPSAERVGDGSLG